jgi:2-amino-4-ketopentanoate thiolase alpha subunit
MIKKGEWVRIHKIILSTSERAPQVPDDTKAVPLEMWDKGFLLTDSELGDEVEIETVTGRRETGTLIEVNPCYDHDYGKFIPELLAIDKQVRRIVFGGGKNE